MKWYILYNPESSAVTAEAAAERLSAQTGGSRELLPMTEEGVWEELARVAAPDDRAVLCGGDGTLHGFINDETAMALPCEIWYVPMGNGNDFARDVGRKKSREAFRVDRYLRGLPTVEAGGHTHRFLNNVSFGVDSYATGEADRIRREKGRKVSYSRLALRGLLRSFAPVDVEVTVDGGTPILFDHAWLSCTMKGRYFGGGVMIAPAQRRTDPERTVSLCVGHCPSRMKMVSIFPGIYSGRHVRHEDVFEVLTGHEIRVRSDQTCFVQADGDSIVEGNGYLVRT